MRTRLPLLPIALLLSGAPLAAQSWDDEPGPWYVGFGSGAGLMDTSQGFDPDTGFTVHGNLGYILGHPGDGRLTLAVEGEYYYSRNRVKDFPVSFGTEADNLETSAGFGNLIADWYWTDATSLYFGGGVGYTERVTLFNAKETGAAYQAKAGMRFHLGGGFSWSLGYRYLKTGDVADALDFQNEQHVFETGVRWEL